MVFNQKNLPNTLLFIGLVILVVVGGAASVILPRLDFSVLARYTLEGTTMSVMLPSKPTRGTTTLDSIAGKLATVEYNSGVGTLLFTINYTDLPEGALKSTSDGSQQGYYESALDRILASTKARVLEKKSVRYGEHSAEDVLLATSSNIGIRTRFLLVNNRFIQLTVTTTSDNIRNKKIEEFMASFVLNAAS